MTLFLSISQANSFIVSVVVTMLYQQHHHFASVSGAQSMSVPSVVHYNFVRNRLPEQRMPTVDSDLPSAILSNSPIATRRSGHQSIYARPYTNRKFSPQYDIHLIGEPGVRFVTNSTSAPARTQRKMINDNDDDDDDVRRLPVQSMANFFIPKSKLFRHNEMNVEHNNNHVNEPQHLIGNGQRMNHIRRKRAQYLRHIPLNGRPPIIKNYNGYGNHFEKANQFAVNVYDGPPPINPSALPTPWPWTIPNLMQSTASRGPSFPASLLIHKPNYINSYT